MLCCVKFLLCELLVFRLDYYTQVQDLNELLRNMALNTLNQEHPMQVFILT
jgi:hypothetical protein